MNPAIRYPAEHEETSTLAVRVVGDGPQDLLWLHGLFGSGNDFDGPACQLATSCRSLLVDLPGHGDSPIVGRVGYAEWARQVIRVLDLMSIERINVAGYSMGGRLALYLALNYPDRIRGALLESTSPGISGAAARAARRAVDGRRALDMQRDGLEQFLSSWYRSAVFSSLRRDPLVMGELVSRRSGNDVESMATIISDLSVGSQPTQWRFLPGVRVPLHFLVGQHDGKYIAISRRAARLSRLITRETVTGAGHCVHLDSPDAYLERVRAWLGRDRSRKRIRP